MKRYGEKVKLKVREEIRRESYVQKGQGRDKKQLKDKEEIRRESGVKR